jgi:hypothetical protein
MIHKINNHITDRKSKLKTYLSNNKNMKLEKKHQIKGALDEMDHILSVVEKHKIDEIKQEIKPKDEVFLFKPIEEKPFMTKVKEFVSDLF